MKKILLVSCFLLLTVTVFAQQFSQYNTGTLFDSFENPAQRAFIPDSSKQYAFNFFIPNFSGNFFLSGDAQASLKSRAFLNMYDNSALKINQGKLNHLNENGDVYLLMLKMFSSLNGDQEIGFSWQARTDGKSLFTDETIAAFNGGQSFEDRTVYNNIFNTNYHYQLYHQIGFTYHEKFSDEFSFGVKVSLLLGIEYQNLNISNSKAVYDKAEDTVGVALKGTYYQSYIPGNLTASDELPTFRSPGAAITIGTRYKTEDGYIIQANVKDLGFIHWSPLSRVYHFNGNTVIQGISTPAREDSIYNKVRSLIRTNGTVESFTTPIDGRAELSISKSFWIGEDKTFKYSPTVVASKELFYTGFVGALVNPFQYKSYVITATTTYDDLKTFNLGLQLMYKTPNFEIYLGSDKLTQSTSLMSQAISKNALSIAQNPANTAVDFFLGFSLKFGPTVEHPMNASTIPTGEKGFLGRLWNRLFKTYE